MHGALAVLLVAALSASAQTDRIVSNAFPQSLVTPGGLRQYGYATGTISGENVIAAAYSDGQFGELAILTPAGKPIATFAPDNLVGIRPEVALTDIDGDGEPEVVVTMNQSRGLPATWIFRFIRDQIVPLGPFRRVAELPETDLGDVQFLRTDATNRLSLLDSHTESQRLYTWNGSGFDGGQAVDLVITATRGAGSPRPSITSFKVDSVPATRTLLLVNGDASGARRAARVSVFLNRKEVLGETTLNRTVAAVRVPVTLKEVTNQISVAVKFDRGALVTVLVLRQAGRRVTK
jgi:hypothetical protein